MASMITLVLKALAALLLPLLLPLTGTPAPVQATYSADVLWKITTKATWDSKTSQPVGDIWGTGQLLANTSAVCRVIFQKDHYEAYTSENPKFKGVTANVRLDKYLKAIKRDGKLTMTSQGPEDQVVGAVYGVHVVSWKFIYSPCTTPTPSATTTKPTVTPTPTTTSPVPTTTTPVPTTTTPVPTTTTPVPTTTTPTPTSPASPPAKVAYSAWMWPVATCGPVVVTQSRVETTTPWTMVNGVWVPDDAHATTVMEYRDHLLVGDEVIQFQSENPEALCYVSPSTSPTPIITAPTATLANTGAPSMMGWAVVFGLVALGAGGGLLFLKKYKVEDVDTESDN